MEKGVLIDLTRCIGCRGCQVACKGWNERRVTETTMQGDYTNPPELNASCYTHIRFHEEDKDQAPVWNFVKDQCLHCKEPACASACPVGALIKTKEGPVAYDFDRCIGCRYCMVACPFQIPKYDWESTAPWVEKCTFCSERIQEGMIPSCIKTCPTGTMLFGEREEVVAEAKKRISENPEKYVDHIYGLEEAGGTSWVYISSVPFATIGFNTAIPNVALPNLTWGSLSKIPAAVGGFVAVLGAVAWFRNRGERESERGKT
jgi:formate dehydrogenase iron-sulfur subunit